MKRVWGATSFFAAAAMIMAAAPSAYAQGTPVRGGTAVMAIGADPSTLNRNIGSNNADGHVACVLYQGLMRMDAKYQPQPLLAKTWAISPDGKTYSFELQKADWQDGKPMTSADVKYSIEEVSKKYSSVFAGAGRMIDSIDTPAPDKVVFHLKEPYGPFLISLACQQGGGVLPKHIFEGTNPLQNPATTTSPVGLGPFLLQEWKHDNYLRLAKNLNYWEKGKPYLDEVVIKVIPQPSARIQALQAGEVDFVPSFYMPSTAYGALKGSPTIGLPPSPSPPTVDFLFYNLTKKPLDDKRVRQALFIAMDRDLLLHTAYLDIGGVGTMPFTNKLTWAANPDIDYRKIYPFDPAKANAMLDAAGYKKGADGMRFKLDFLVASDDPNGPTVAAAIKGMWRNVGVDLNIEQVDRTAATKKQYTDLDAQVSTNAYTSFADPALGMARAWITSSIKQPFGNASGYSNPEVDQLFTQGERAIGDEARGAFYKKVQPILAEDLPVITLHEQTAYNAQAKKLHGIEDEQFLMTWRDAWVEK